MAEALLRARAEERGIALSVSSVGALFDDRAPEPGAIEAMERLGLDISGHRSRIWNEEILRRPDLVVAMEQRQVHEAAVARHSAQSVFTLPDVVARCQAAGARGDESIDQYLARVAVTWTPGARPDGGDLDIEDPMGRSNRAFRKCAAQLSDLIDAVVEMAWPVNQHAADPSPEPSETRSL